MSAKEMKIREMEDKMDQMAYAYCRRMEDPTVEVSANERKWKEFHQKLLAKQN